MDLSNVLITGLYCTASIVSCGLVYKYFTDRNNKLSEIEVFESSLKKEGMNIVGVENALKLRHG